MDRVAELELTAAADSNLNLSTSSLDDLESVASDNNTSSSSIMGFNALLDESKLREIEELRARAAQTEKTMKWWSDCTQSWREKWSKVRNERNKIREECKALTKQLDESLQQVEKLQQEKKILRAELDRHQRQNQSINNTNSTSRKDETDSLKRGASLRLSAPYDWSKSATKAFLDATSDSRKGEIDLDLGSEQNNQATNRSESNSLKSSQNELNVIADSEKSNRALQMKLEEAHKIITAERATNERLHDQIEALTQDIGKLQSNIQQLTVAKDALNFELKTTRQNHECQITAMTGDLEDVNNRNSDLEKRMTNLSDAIENLQIQNAEEWGKREQLETEKFQLEREIKKLKLQLVDAQSQTASQKKASMPGTPNSETTILKTQIQQLQLQINTSKHNEAKMRKTVAEKTGDMELLERRCNQSESEVKSLRNRVEQLKKETIEALEENDAQSAQLKKANRDLEDRTEAMQELEAEIEMLKRKIEQGNMERELDDENID